MEAACKERTSLRKIFTKNFNLFEELLATGKSTETDLLLQNRKLKEIAEQLTGLDLAIKTFMLENAELDEEKLTKELSSALEYREKWLKVDTKCNYILNQQKKGGKSEEVKRSFLLPKITLKKFDGSIKNWLSFWGQFNKIDSDSSIDEDDKFLYLLHSIEENTEVYNLIASYPPCGTSYRSCINELKTRYAREELLIEVYVREILALVLQGKQDLVDLYDKLNAHLRALNTLGVSKCAAFILPLVESAIPTETLKLWERNKASSIKKEGPDEVLIALMDFLKSEVESLQRIEIAKNTFIKEKYEEHNEPSASCLFTATKNTESKNKICIWCKKDTHVSVECYKLAKMTIEERRNHLHKENACTICLKKGHFYKTCKAFIKCHICGRRHTVAMCPGKENNQDETKKINEHKPQEKEKKSTTTTTTNISSASYQQQSTLLQTVILKIKNGDKNVIVRALFDNGSQKTYIKEETVKKLAMDRVRQEDLRHCLFGGTVLDTKKHNVYNIKVESLDGKFSMDMEAVGQNTICGPIDKLCVNNNISKILKKHSITLSDVENCHQDIDLLIGADYSGLLMTSAIVYLENGMVAINTKLGWTIQGRQIGSSDNIVTSMFCVSKIDLTDLWSLESLGIRDPVEQKTKTQAEAEMMASFEKTVKKEEDGRYQVQLPFKVGTEDLLSNYEKAKQRLDSTTKKLITCGKFQDYDSVFKEWHNLKIIETVPPSEENRHAGHYLPHKAVIKESSLTSTIRPVYDASTPDKNGLSLNGCLDKGLNFIDNIPRLLIGFRKGAIGITADIAKAFLQISLPSEDRNYLKFLWWENETLQKVIVYRHCRVVFGLTSSPFLLAATLKHHLQHITGKYKETAQLLLKSFYVDNCVYSLNTEQETYKFIEESKEVLKMAQFDLRMWVTAPLQINEAGKQIVPILGLNWDTGTDELSCSVATLPPLSSLEKVTKRIVLSLAQKIYDPIGLTCPVSLPPKLLLREIWSRKLTWDEALPGDLEEEFLKWYVHIQYILQCKVPRRLSAVNINKCNLSLHLFSDASKNAFGVCIFLRAEYNNEVTLRLVAAKSRVAPSKNVSIPRLELMAAVIGVRLLVETKQSLQLPNCQEHCWTDSSVIMYWICKDLSWNTFIGNRVREIKEHTKTINWSHIPGSLNWADLPSRGCNAKQLMEQNWTQGPPFLLRTPEEWPKSAIIMDEDEAKKELKKTTHKVNACVNENFTDRLLYFSKYSKIIRMFAWTLRFIKNCRGKERTLSADITVEEYEEAENKIMRLIQHENEENLKNRTQNLNIFMDKQKVLRIKTKLLLSEVKENFKSPIIVLAKHKIIQEMVKQKHIQLLYAGTNTLIAELRKKFWIFGIRRLVKSVITNCMVCKRHRAKPKEAPVAPLPIDRIQSSTPFEVTGVDLAGPLILKNGEKCWIVLYTCAVYRAIHLELTPSLSTESFIRTFRRFIARRGRVNIIYSDNGTNFLGTKNLLESIDWNEVQNETCADKIRWKLNAPTAAWWGGFWERMVRTVKDLLRRMLGKASVNYDELQTILCDCESVINNRPLTYIQDDSAESLEPLTPSCFLQPLPSSVTVDFDNLDGKSINLRLKYLQKLRDDVRQRFRSEYLTELIQRGKEKGTYEQLKEGQIVLVEVEGKRIKWPLGIVTKVFTGKDGVNRSAEVKTSSGIKVRPVQKLYSLEMSTEDTGNYHSIEKYKEMLEENKKEITGTKKDITTKGMEIKQNHREVSLSTEEKVEEKLTRCGRKVKIPSKFTI